MPNLLSRTACRGTIIAMGEAAVSELWHHYKDSSLGYESSLGYGDRRLRNQLVDSYASLVRYVASRVAAGLPSADRTGTEITREDLVSWGTIGLLDAVTKFDPDRGNKFETYAVTRIRGEIVDHLRSHDRVPRSTRTKAKALAAARAELEDRLGRPALDSELAAHLNLSMDELVKLSRDATASILVSLDEASQHSTSEPDSDQGQRWERIRDSESNPDELYDQGEIVTLLASAVDHLPERFKTILYLYYLEEMTLAGIGEVLGVTESRVCQLQGRLLDALREALADKAAGVAA